MFVSNSYCIFDIRECPISNLSGRLTLVCPHNDDYTVKVREAGGEWKDDIRI